MSRDRDDQPRLALPRTVVVLALAGGALLLGPLVALAVRGGLSGLPDALSNPGVRTALRVTAVTSVQATLIAVLLGVPLALVADRTTGPIARFAGLVGEVPLVVPPVVTGLGLLLLLGRNGLMGGLLDAAELRLTFTAAAVVIAQASAATPLVIVATRAGLRTLDPLPEQVAAVHGAGPWARLRLAVLPGVSGAIALGAALGWGRAAGEFGATLTFAGSLPGRTRTLPLEVFATLELDRAAAAAAALLQVLVAVAVLMVGRRLSRARA